MRKININKVIKIIKENLNILIPSGDFYLGYKTACNIIIEIIEKNIINDKEEKKEMICKALERYLRDYRYKQ